MTVTPVLRRQRQKYQEIKVIQGYIVSLKARDTWYPSLKKNIEKDREAKYIHGL